MRKRIVARADGTTLDRPPAADWLDLRSAEVEVTSEDPAHPIEGALLGGGETGWRAAEPGEQTLRLYFEQPLRLQRVSLEFVETAAERTQEIALRWSPDRGQSWHEIVRQQWNFSPTGATREMEDWRVDLAGVTVLELSIVPDTSQGAAHASLARLRLA